MAIGRLLHCDSARSSRAAPVQGRLQSAPLRCSSSGGAAGSSAGGRAGESGPQRAALHSEALLPSRQGPQPSAHQRHPQLQPRPTHNGSAGAVARAAAVAEAPTVEAPPLECAVAPAEAQQQVLPAEEEEVEREPYSLVGRQELAGGVLELVRWEGERLLRVWLPPGYSRVEAARQPYPLLLLNDGQNLFDDSLSFSGHSWRVAETAAALITSGRLPPFLVVGVDHAGANRPLDYLPYKPGTGPGGFRSDAAKWPGGGVAAYMERLTSEVLPWLAERYGTSATDPELLAFGGSSFGGICALWAAMHYPHLFGAVLAESPSLWIAEERFLREDLTQHTGPWPQRIFLAMGGQEYSGIRAKPGPKWDALLVGYCRELAELLQSRGLDSSRLQWEVDPEAMHSEEAWAARLPQSLPFLLGHWWAGSAARNAHSLFFTSPRKLQAGQPAVLFVNKSRSATLAGAPGQLCAKLGFNNWALGQAELPLQPALQLELGVQGQQQQGEGQQQQQQGEAGVEPKWQCAAFTVPEGAYEMHFVLTDGCGNWDNCDGADFYLRVKLSSTGESISHPGAAPASSSAADTLIASAAAAAQGPVDELARRSAAKLYFTSPEVPVAGAPARLYFNRARSWELRHNPNVKVLLGYNGWEVGVGELQLCPTSLWRSEFEDWWATPVFDVPQQAFELAFAFTDGHGAWDSNDGHNYSSPVRQLTTPEQQAAARRTIASMEVVDHAGGKLHICTLSRRQVTDKASKESRWKEEKVLRVWTPPGYSKESSPPGGWPVLYMNDAQNMFEDWMAHQGHAWNVGHCAAGLIARGDVPPFIVVAVDSAGPMRSLNYLPYKPGTGVGGFRGDAERWPGGGCECYMRRLVTELMPLVADTFGTATDPARVAFGGGSFAGVTALYAAMHYPHVFGAVLAESPSLWIAEGRFMQDMWAYRGPLPERLFMGCGTREYSATRDHDRDDVDALLLHYYCDAAQALEAAGLRGPKRLAFQVEEGAGHHELAWSWRLTGALTFLLSPWWDE